MSGTGNAFTLTCPYCEFAIYEFGDGKGEAEMREHMADPHGINVTKRAVEILDTRYGNRDTLLVTIQCDTCNNWLIMGSPMNDALIAYGKHCQEVHPI